MDALENAPPAAPPTWQVVAHSVGTWCAYELLRAVQAAGLPMPIKVFLSGGGRLAGCLVGRQGRGWEAGSGDSRAAPAWCALRPGGMEPHCCHPQPTPPPPPLHLACPPPAAMASPDIPWDQRPWRQQRGLDEEQFKVGALLHVTKCSPCGQQAGQGERRGVALAAGGGRGRGAATEQRGGVLRSPPTAHLLHPLDLSPALTPAAPSQEECRGWDVNELVFSAALWGTYQARLPAAAALPWARTPAGRDAQHALGRMAGRCRAARRAWLSPGVLPADAAAGLTPPLALPAAAHARRLHAV